MLIQLSAKLIVTALFQVWKLCSIYSFCSDIKALGWSSQHGIAHFNRPYFGIMPISPGKALSRWHDMSGFMADVEDKQPNGRIHHETGSSEVCAEAAALQEMEADHLQEDPSSLYIDLRPFMDTAPITVR